MCPVPLTHERTWQANLLTHPKTTDCDQRGSIVAPLNIGSLRPKVFAHPHIFPEKLPRHLLLCEKKAALGKIFCFLSEDPALGKHAVNPAEHVLV